MTARHLVLHLAVGSLAISGSGLAIGQATVPGPRFSDARSGSGIDFVHATGGSGLRYMVETMGSGVAAADLDGDGRLDLYFAQGAWTPGAAPPPGSPPPANRWYRGGDALTFSPAPPGAGANDTGWSMGVAVADYDDDGLADIYVTNLAADSLYRNNGDGSFSDVTARAGIDNPGWASSAAWADFDQDGDLDLYVANYVDFDWDNHKFCGDPRRNLRAFCHPDVYRAVADRLFHSRGDGTFVDISEAAGIADVIDGKGLGVVVGDYDADGDPDLYVANDSTRNFLYTNDGGSGFVEDGLLAGVAFSADGQAEAGMGTDHGDFDGDGRLDLVVTNLDFETNSLYRNLGGGAFTDVSFAAGVGEPSLLRVGFGINWLDYDHDGDVDLFVANGHIIDNIADLRDGIDYAQANQLLVNQGGRLVEPAEPPGSGFELIKVSRGSAIGDLDGDGDLDIAVSNNGQEPDVLRNDGGAEAGHWISLRLTSRDGNRGAIGARVRVLAEGSDTWQVREVTAGSSYASSSDPRVHFGLGQAGRAGAVSITWPGGDFETIQALPGDRVYVVRKGRGVIAARAAAAR